MRKFVIGITATILLALCLGQGQNIAFAQEAKKINFGILNSITGPAAPWGNPIYRSEALSAWKVNDQGGFKVKGQSYTWNPILYDHKYVPAEAAKACNTAIYGDKVSFLSVQGGSTCVACIPLMKENNILSLNVSGAGKTVTNPNNPLVFRYLASIEGMYAAFLPYLKKQEGIKTVASINPDDDTGRSGVEAIEPIAKLNNLNIVAKEYFERGIKEFSPVLTRLISKNPDLIETGYTDPTSAALVCKQARELGYKGAILLAWMPDPKQVVSLAGPHAEKVYMTVNGPYEPTTPAEKEIYQRFTAKWSATEFDPLVWSYIDMFQCMTKAIVETQSFDAFVLAKHLENMTWESHLGTLKYGGMKLFGIKRQLIIPLGLDRVENGKILYKGLLQVPAGVLD